MSQAKSKVLKELNEQLEAQKKERKMHEEKRQAEEKHRQMVVLSDSRCYQKLLLKKLADINKEKSAKQSLLEEKRQKDFDDKDVENE